MDHLSVFDMLRQAIYVTIGASLPILLVAMGIGLVIGILQTATSIQEQTLAFIPKILAVLLSLIFFGSSIFGQVVDFARDLLGQLHRFVQ